MFDYHILSFLKLKMTTLLEFLRLNFILYKKVKFH